MPPNEVQWMPSQYLLRHENNQRSGLTKELETLLPRNKLSRLCYTFRPTEVSALVLQALVALRSQMARFAFKFHHDQIEVLPDGSQVVLGASWMINQAARCCEGNWFSAQDFLSKTFLNFHAPTFSTGKNLPWTCLLQERCPS